MNINQLLYDHQLAKLCAQHALKIEDRTVNCDLTGHYAGLIDDWRRDHSLPQNGWPQDHRPDQEVLAVSALDEQRGAGDRLHSTPANPTRTACPMASRRSP